MQQHCPEYEDYCSNVIYQTIDVGLPISLMPSINLGNIKIMCCGEPRVECCSSNGNSGGLELRVIQTITYKIPIEHRIEANTGDVMSECKKGNMNTNCNPCRY